VVLAVQSIERGRHLLADGRLHEAFHVSRQARDASGLWCSCNELVVQLLDLLMYFDMLINTVKL